VEYQYYIYNKIIVKQKYGGACSICKIKINEGIHSIKYNRNLYCIRHAIQESKKIKIISDEQKNDEEPFSEEDVIEDPEQLRLQISALRKTMVLEEDNKEEGNKKTHKKTHKKFCNSKEPIYFLLKNVSPGFLYKLNRKVNCYENKNYKVLYVDSYFSINFKKIHYPKFININKLPNIKKDYQEISKVHFHIICSNEKKIARYIGKTTITYILPQKLYYIEHGVGKAYWHF
jgi:hypothetical protein